MKYISLNENGNYDILLKAVKNVISKTDVNKLSWKDDPSFENGTQAVYTIMKEKLNGAYTERFVMTVLALKSLIMGHNMVHLCQIKNENTPFDANGWVVVCVDDYPMFHISPSDLNMNDIKEIVNVIDDKEDHPFKWKGTNKIQEFLYMLDAVTE